jgi:hypothetical protein
MLKDFVKITAGPDRAEANYTEVFRAIETATGEGLDQFARGLLVGVVCRAPDETDDQFRRRVRAQYKSETFVDRYGGFGGMGASEFRRAAKAPPFSVALDLGPRTLADYTFAELQTALQQVERSFGPQLNDLGKLVGVTRWGGEPDNVYRASLRRVLQEKLFKYRLATASGADLDLVGEVMSHGRTPDFPDADYRVYLQREYRRLNLNNLADIAAAYHVALDVVPPSFSDPVRADVPPTIENHAPTNVQAARYTSDGWTSAVTAELRRRERERAPRVQPDYPDDNWPHAGVR